MSADVALQRAHAYLEDARDSTLDTSLRAEALDQARVALLEARRAGASPEQLLPIFESLLQNCAQDRSHVIRSVVPQAVEDLCARDPRAFIPAATPFLTRALHDTHVLVAARAVRALTTLFRKTIGLIVSVGVGDTPLLFKETVLESWLKLQQKTVSLIHVHDEGLRKASVKFAETVVLAFSYSGGPGSADHFTLDYIMKKGSSSRLLDARALEKEGIRCVKSIAQLLLSSLQGNLVTVKPDGSSTIRGLPPASFMTAISVLGNLVRRRRKILELTLPPFLSVVPAIIGKPPCEAFNALSDGQKQSIVAVVRFNLGALRGYQHLRMGRVGVNINQATEGLASFERETDMKRREMATIMADRERARRAAAAASAEAEKRRAAAQAHPIPTLKRPRGADPSLTLPRLPPKEAFALSQSIIQSMPPQEVVNFIMTRLLLNIPLAHTVPGAQRANEQNRNGMRSSAEEPIPKRPRKSRFGSKETDSATSNEQSVPQAKKSVVRKVAPPVLPIRLSAQGSQKLIAACCRRIMTRESRAVSSGAGPLRLQLLARLLTKMAQDDGEIRTKFCDEACKFITDNMGHNMPLALAWLHSLAWEGEAAVAMEVISRKQPKPGPEPENKPLVEVREDPNGLTPTPPPEPMETKEEPAISTGEEKHNPEEVEPKDKPGKEETDTQDEMTDEGQSSAHTDDDGDDAPPESFEPLVRNAAYERILTSLLSYLNKKTLTNEAQFSELITESPVLPVSVIETLRQFCQDPSRIKLALHTLRDIIIKRPGNDRTDCLLMLLGFTLSEDEVLRGPAIRLIANKIFVESVGEVSDAIQKFAVDTLKTSISKLSKEAATSEVNQVTHGSQLLTALCGQKHELLKEIGLLYKDAPREAQKVLLAKAKDLAAHLGMSARPIKQLISADLLPAEEQTVEDQIVKDGLEELALEVLQAVLKKFGKPSEEIVSAAQKRYAISRNTKFIIAVLPGLKKASLLEHLAAIVSASYVQSEDGENSEKRPIEVSARTEGFKEIVSTIMSSRPSAVTPAELLIELHNIDPTAAASSAIRACFEAKSVYKQESIAQAIQQLIEKTTIPDLFMRTVHLARIFYPELEKYLSETVMKRLIEKQVWKNKLLWEGYLLYCVEVKEKSLKMLLTLPVPQLKDALDKQAALRSLFKELVANPKNAKKIHVKHRKVIAAAIKKAPAES